MGLTGKDQTLNLGIGTQQLAYRPQLLNPSRGQPGGSKTCLGVRNVPVAEIMEVCFERSRHFFLPFSIFQKNLYKMGIISTLTQ